MGIISRFADIMSANINALFDSWEDPSKMIDQTLRNLEEELADVRKETSAIMGEANIAKQNVDKLKAEVDKYDSAARKALQAGNETDATTLIARKQEFASQLTTATQTYTVAQANADKMRQMHDKLTQDIATLQSRRATIKAQVKMAEATDKVTKATETIGKTDAMGTFSRMEEKSARMLAEATARAELAGSGLSTDPAADVAAKYESGSSVTVSDELARMKAELGIQ